MSMRSNPDQPHDELFRSRLENMIDINYPLVKWRIKIGEEDCEWLLTQTLQAGKKLGVLETSNLGKLVMNTTFMEKAIAHPVDSKLFNRMRKVSNKLRTILGRVIRDIERKAKADGTTLTAKMIDLLALAKRLKVQQKSSKNKVHAIHAPEVACIAKGKARNP